MVYIAGGKTIFQKFDFKDYLGYVHISTGAWGRQKRAPYSLELESQVGVNCLAHVSAGDQTHVVTKNSLCAVTPWGVAPAHEES